MNLQFGDKLFNRLIRYIPGYPKLGKKFSSRPNAWFLNVLTMPDDRCL